MTASVRKFLSLIPFRSLFTWSAEELVNMRTTAGRFPAKKLGDILSRAKETIKIQNDIEYRRVTVRIKGNGVCLRDKVMGRQIGTKRQFVAREGQLIISRIDARNGAFGIVPKDLDGAIVTNDFLLFNVVDSDIQYVVLILSSSKFQPYWQSKSTGTTNRQRIDETSLLNTQIPLPPKHVQTQLVADFNAFIEQAKSKQLTAVGFSGTATSYLFKELSDVDTRRQEIKKKTDKLLSFARLSQITCWGMNKILSESVISNFKYPVVNLITNPDLVVSLFRGKGPSYDDKSTAIVLNQKCNRWNEIRTEYAKKVNAKWFSQIQPSLLTRKGDVLINSTGEGTIGRASCVIEACHEGLFIDSHLLLLRLNIEVIDPLFYVFVFNSSIGQTQVNNLKGAEATKQTELGIENVRKITIPLPPITIQKKIVAEIYSLQEQTISDQQQAVKLLQRAHQQFENEVFG